MIKREEEEEEETFSVAFPFCVLLCLSFFRLVRHLSSQISPLISHSHLVLLTRLHQQNMRNQSTTCQLQEIMIRIKATRFQACE